MRRVLAVTVPVALAAGILAAASPAGAATRPVQPASADRPVLTADGHHPVPSPRRGATAPAPSGPARLDMSATAQRPAANGTVRVDVAGNAATVADQVRAAGGRVLVAANGHSTAVVPKSALTRLAGSSGVTRVSASQHPYATSTPAPAGAGPSGAADGAQAWQTAGITGTGVKVAIIDEGFGVDQAEYTSQLQLGNLGPNTSLVNEDCTDAANQPTAFDGSSHGLAVAELLQQQAPSAQLYLYCVSSEPGAAQAELAAEQAGVRIISSSLAWFGQGRGDGTSGFAGSVPATAERARQHGILWVNSAGNYVPQHWSGTLADVDRDGLLDIGNHDDGVYPYESDFFTVAPGSASAPTSMDVIFSWDQWPVNSTQVALEAGGAQCTADFGSGGTDDCQAYFLPTQAPTQHAANSAPTIGLSTPPNTSQFAQIWEVSVQLPGSFPAGARYDLFGLGDLDGASALACPTSDSNGDCVFATAAKQGSVTSPADSPYVLAAGAATSTVGADGISGPGTLEYFSSQGPTIDGRTKPEITGWDGAPSAVPEFADGFYGTSAAAPTVAGAAALVASANPNLDAAQLQDFLQRRAQNGTPNTPPNNATGYGLLTLGAPTGVDPPAGARYTPVAPTRLLDTRTTTGGHHAPLGAGGTVTVAVPGLPADATAVAINLAGVGASATTFLSAYPAQTAWPGTANLNLSRSTDPTASVFAIVGVRNGAITIRNNLGSTNVVADELGYFGTGAEAGRYSALPQAKRVLDTRTTNNRLQPGQQITVDPALPADATAAVVTVTTTNTTAPGYVSAAPRCSPGTSTVNFAKYTRGNLAVVGLSGGKFCVVGSTPADVVVDVVGYFGPSGAEYVALSAAQRIVDTRTGNGGYADGRPSRAIGANTAATFYGSSVGVVPATATALVTSVTEADATSTGYLTVFPGTAIPSPLTANINFSRGRTVPNAVVATLSGNQFGIYNATGSTDAVVDLFGYFVPAGS